MQDFVERQGLAYLAHILGRLYDRFLRGFSEWNPEVGLKAPPRTHSTMHALFEHGPMSVTELASMIRQSHPLVIKWIRQLSKLGFVDASSDPLDGRRTILSLTEAGIAEFGAQQNARILLARTFQRLLTEADADDVFAALWRVERALQIEPFTKRLRDEAKRQEKAE
jgi:DNA-binding MarR family transcriptional regulator